MANRSLKKFRTKSLRTDIQTVKDGCKMNDIQSFVRDLKLKDALLGGFEKESVYSVMKELTEMYQKEIERLQAEKEELRAEQEAAVSKLNQANQEIQLLEFQLSEEKKNQNKYELKFNALTQAIEAVNENKEKVIGEAEETAQKMIEKAEKQRQKINQECLLQKQQMESFLSKMTDAKQRFSVSMDGIYSDLEKILLEVDGLRKDSLEQAFNVNETFHLTEVMAGSVPENEIPSSE